MNYFVFIIVFTTLFNRGLSIDKCPYTSAPIVPPCYYLENEEGCTISCGGQQAFDLSGILSDIKRRLPADWKQFSGLHLHNTAIEELPANAFQGLQFGDISIVYGVKRVHKQAFDGTDTTVKSLTIYGSLVDQRADNRSDLFGAIQRLRALESLEILHTNITELPTNSLSNLPHLRRVVFRNNPIKSILSYAFNNLTALELIQVQNSPIEHVFKYAFAVNNTDDGSAREGSVGPQLNISLTTDGLTNSALTVGALQLIGRPTRLVLNENPINYLDIDVFGFFLAQGALNKVEVSHINCTDSRNYWVRDEFPVVWNDLSCQ